jgi:hypothetical protein
MLEPVEPPAALNAVVVVARAYGYALPQAEFPQASERTTELGRGARVLALDAMDVCQASDCVAWTLALVSEREHRLRAAWMPSISLLRDADALGDGRHGGRVGQQAGRRVGPSTGLRAGLRRVGRTAVGAEYETVVLREGQPPVRAAFSAAHAVEPLALIPEAGGYAVIDAKGAPVRKVAVREPRPRASKARSRSHGKAKGKGKGKGKGKITKSSKSQKKR